MINFSKTVLKTLLGTPMHSITSVLSPFLYHFLSFQVQSDRPDSTSPGNGIIFLQTNNVILNGVKQWVEVFHESNPKETYLQERIMLEDDLVSETILLKKKFSGLGKHKHVRV
jgi:hypothetical protein